MDGVGRARHAASVLGAVIIEQGGQDNFVLRPASPATMDVVANGYARYSFPWTGYARDDTKILGLGTDSIDGGMPPMPQSLTPSLRFSMPPITLSSVCNWAYPDGSNFADFYNASINELQFPPETAWSGLGMLSGHRAVKVLDSVFYVGGNGTIFIGDIFHILCNLLYEIIR